jgi:transcription-repair coupling factor (superfamily II helicase)
MEGVPDAPSRVREALVRDRVAVATGLTGAARGYLLATLIRDGLGPWLCVAADEDAADRLAQDVAFFLGGLGSKDRPVVQRLPADEILPYDELAPDREAMFERLAGLFHMTQATRSLRAVVVSARALARRYLRPELIDSQSELIAPNTDIDRDALVQRLVAMGYQSSPLVEDAGTFSVRGGILDVFSPLYEQPARLDFFGNTVESLKLFDPETQRSIKALEELAIPPASEIVFNPTSKEAAIAAVRAAADAVNRPSLKLRELIDHISEGHSFFGLEALMPGFHPEGLVPLRVHIANWAKNAMVFVDEPVEVQNALGELQSSLDRAFAEARDRGDVALEPAAHFVSRDEVMVPAKDFQTVESFGSQIAAASRKGTPIAFSFVPTAEIRREILQHHGEEGALTPFVDRLQRWRDAGIAACVACGTAGQADRLKRLLLDRKLMVRTHGEAFAGDGATIYDASVHAHLFTQEVSAGFVDAVGRLAVLSEEDVFGARMHRAQKAKRVDQAFVASFRELKEGDLIVHVDYGIGRYSGLSRMTIRGISADVLVIEYSGRDKVYLPVARMRLVQKFSGADADKIALDKLGSQSWERRKKQVKEHLLKMAAELLGIYAARAAHPGHAFTPPDNYFRQFEADFPFEETPDQAKAVADVLGDMQSAKPMDRLVCGDVGFGKTEVALRAIFKSVLDKKQVAVLVPTTVLAAQHYRTLRERFKDYPVTVEVVSRMRSAEEVRGALARAAEGKVDVLVGTHRILADDVAFKDLGLVIIDEEHRFGVRHKEKLKKYRAQVDVLTLTATPIPRTLHMAMSGIRDMSVIATPPKDRKSIRTFVLKFDPSVIAEAIRREIARGGQIYFVHNRVRSILSMFKYLNELLPDVRIAVAHGQMGEGMLERVMTEFVEGKYDVLLCSSIIESGLDIPAANTIIVNRADHFGLAQLYQIRGRVGRSAERAYAYLLVPAKKGITRDAQRRLDALQSFTELGAGFSIASHDLEIRGAGNLLGPDQSGQIAAVGFDLYAQLMDEAVRELKGEPPRDDVDPDVTLPVSALVPEEYVPDVHQRLVLYKRFAQAATDDDLSDLRSELVDRYGEIPLEVDSLTEVMSIKIEMRRLRLRSLDAGPGRLVFALGTAPALDAGKLAALVQRSKGAYRLTPDMKLLATADPKLQGIAWLTAAKKAARELAQCAA